MHRWDEAMDTGGDPDDPTADPFNWVFVDLPRADVLIKRGDLAAASELVTRIGAVLDGQDDVQYGTELADLRARLAARSGRTADARAAVHDGLRVALTGQDLWLVAPGRDEDADRQRELLVDGYETMRRFDRRTLKFVEPLRALRILRYAAWIAQRWRDPAFTRAFPDWDDARTWQRELGEMESQRARVESALG